MRQIFECPTCGYKQYDEAPVMCPQCGTVQNKFVMSIEKAGEASKEKPAKSAYKNEGDTITNEEFEALKPNSRVSKKDSKNPDMWQEEIASKYSSIVYTILGILGVITSIVGIVVCVEDSGLVGFILIVSGLLVLLIALVTNAFIQTFVNISYRLAKIEENTRKK